MTAATRPRRRSSRPWARYAAGSEVDHFAKFCREHLLLSNDRWAGQPLKLEPFQRRMMGEALAFDEDGWPVWNSVVMVLPRKNGKTQLLAAYAVYRLLTTEGSPEILLAAASDRNAGRLFKAAASFIRQSPVLSEIARVRDYVGEIVREDGAGVIYRVASDPNRLHGYDPSDVIMDELGQWTKPSLEEAHAALVSGGGARTAPRTFTITTPGEASTRHSSILGRLLDSAEEAEDREDSPGLRVRRLPDSRMLVYAWEAPTLDPSDTRAMKLANPAPWITKDFLAKQAANSELTRAQVLQLHGGVWAQTDTTFVAPHVLTDALTQETIPDGARVVLGFDGSERRDETWLVACTLDGLIEPLRRWQRPKSGAGEWRVPRGDVHAAVADAMSRFEVVELAPDPPGWYSEVDEWAVLYGDEVVVEFDTKQTTRMAPACERLRAGLLDREARIGGPLSRALLEHLGNCHAVETTSGVTVRKDHPDSPRKVDGAVASMIAYDRALWHAQNAPTRSSWSVV